MNDETLGSGPVLRLFQVHTKPGCAAELIRKFAGTSADVVAGQPGNQGYFFGQGVGADEDYVIFTSVWRDLDAVKARFGDTWRDSFLPPGYGELIEDCSVRHIDVGTGWFVNISNDA